MDNDWSRGGVSGGNNGGGGLGQQQRPVGLQLGAALPLVQPFGAPMSQQQFGGGLGGSGGQGPDRYDAYRPNNMNMNTRRY